MIRLAKHVFRALRRDPRGAALVEFGLVAPLFVLMLMGLFEFGMQVYARSLIHGAMQEAARDATLEGADLDIEDLDQAVRWQVRNVIPRAEFEFTRTNYANFSDVGQPELFTDQNNDGECNNNEPFEDANANGIWDADRGRDGLGGARDAVLYEVTATYDRMFPLHSLMGWDSEIMLEASTVLRNQPFDAQAERAAVGNCL
jgi:Flp pilus assembly pilin Flp